MKKGFVTSIVISFIIVFAPALVAGKFSYELKTDHPDAIYKKGETVRFSVQLLEDKKPAKGYKVTYKITGTGGLKKEGQFTSTEKPYEVSASLDCPGWLLADFTAYGKDGKSLETYKRGARGYLSGEIGAMVAPLEIKPVTANEPADFDEFWETSRAQLKKVPIKAKLTEVKVPAEYKDKIKLYDVAVDSPGKMPVTGYLMMPVNADSKSLPVIIEFNSSVIRSAKKPFKYADKNVIVFDVNPFGIPNGKSKEYYQELKKTSLRGFPHKNKKNRETFFFHDVFLRAMRALEYVKTLPEWDGKHLVITGGSMGSAQTIAAIAFDPDVTFALVDIPTFCDFAGIMATPKRRSSWPRLVRPPFNPQITKAVSYYDGVHFAKRIKCPIYVCTGFIDNLAPPESVFAFYNNLPESTEKHMSTNPVTGHFLLTPNTKGLARLDELFKKSK